MVSLECLMLHNNIVALALVSTLQEAYLTASNDIVTCHLTCYLLFHFPLWFDSYDSKLP